MQTNPVTLAAVAGTAEMPVVETVQFSSEVSEEKKHGHRKVAQLPKPLRDRINTMLDDSLTYPEIIENLRHSDPPLPYPISEMNLSRWKDTGYSRYLARQERLQIVSINRESASDLLANNDTTTLAEGTLQIIASQYFELLVDFSPESLKQKLAEDPLKYTRFLNVFARLTREILHLKKHREACAKAVVAEFKRLNPDRHLSDTEEDLLTDKMEEVFRIHPLYRRRAKAAAPPPASTANHEPSI